MCWPLNYGYLHHINRSLLNTLWIIYSFGSSSWNASWLISFEILKDLYLFWLSFFKHLFEWIFLDFSHILSPTLSPYEFCLFLSNCFFIASFAIFIDFVASSQLLCNPMRKSSSFSNSICTVIFPFYRCLPKLSSNRILSIAVCLLLLYWNSIAANYSVQLSCW